MSRKSGGRNMSANTLRIGLVAFTVLAAVAITNMVMLQPSSGRRAASKPSRAVSVSEIRPDAATLRPEERAPLQQIATAEPKPEPAQPAAVTSSQDVTRAIQRELKERGYEAGVADGQPGLMTRAAIMAYEHDRSMNLTGEPTQQLLKQILLNTHPAAAAAATRSGAGQEQSMHATQVIRTVQQSLVTLGYLPGKVDGRMGDDTVRAIREFELDQGLHETGRVSGQLVARLSRLAGQGRLGSAR